MENKINQERKNRYLDIAILAIVYLIANSTFFINDSVEISFIIKVILLPVFIIFFYYYIRKHNLPKPEYKTISISNIKYLPFLLMCFSNLIYIYITKQTNTNLDIKELGYGFITSLLVATCEEFVFRGVITKEFSKDNNEIKTILYSSLVFGLVHLLNISSVSSLIPTLTQVAYSFVLGLFLSFIYVRTDNIILCIVFHFLFNFINNDLITSLYSYEIDIYYYLFSVLIGFILLLYGMLLFFKDKKKEEE